MADPPSSPATLGPSSRQPTTDSVNNPTPKPDQHPSSATAPAPPPLKVNPNPNPVVPVLSPAPPTMTSFAPPISGASPAFRPAPQFSPLPNFQNPSVPPPGVSSAPVMAPVSVPPQVIQYPLAPGQLHNPALRPFTPIPNGYAAVPGAGPPGLPRYPSPYPTIARPAFPPRPPGAIGVLPRPLVPGIQGVRPVVPPVIRPAAVPSVTPAEKPQTTVYIGKIAPTVDNDFMLSLLRLCGPVKSWKRQDLTDGTPRGFGFCEFESAEGVLHALRLLSKLVIDGQELVLNVNQATRAYLEQYVEKKKENAKQVKDREVAGSEKESESSAVDGKNELVSADDPSKQSDSGDKENPDPTIFGIVTEEDQQADREASGKIANMIEERLKAKPLPPPPPMSGAPDSSTKPYAELASRSRDGDSDVDAKRNDGTEVRKDDETISNSRAASVHGRSDTSSPDRRHDRRSRDRDRDQDLKREKEREIERLERETERERIRKEREQRRKIEEAEREYERYLRDWEQREKEKEKQRQYEKEKEKERERKRKKEILYDEEEDEDDDSRKRWRRSALEEKRRKRLREKEEDLADRVKEEEEITEAKKQAEEEKSQRQQYEALRFLAARAINGGERTIIAEESIEKNNDNAGQQEQTVDSSHDNQMLGVATFQNGSAHESNMAVSEGHQISAAPTKKLGFGLLGSGKRTTVPSVFNEEEDAQKEKKMRPLVPIDYSTEELQAVQPSVSGATPPNLVAAAEFAKRISIVGHKEEKIDIERERSRRSSDKSTRDRDRNDDDNSRTREESKEKNMDRDRDRSHGADNSKTTDNQKFLDAKQLIDMIPKTKEELFSYEINWDVYDEHELHERMRPWISKKITEFLGEEEKTLVDYIVSSTQEHVKASRMLEQLQTILDEEAEMFVLKMWRMLIFEIKKVETGLALRPKS